MERAIHTGAKNVDLFKRLIFSFDPGQNPDIWETARQKPGPAGSEPEFLAKNKLSRAYHPAFLMLLFLNSAFVRAPPAMLLRN